MSLTRVFRSSLYALVSLAAAMLAYGEESLFPSGITIGLAIFVLISGERRAWLQINSVVANILGVIALIAAGTEFFGGNQDSRLLAGAHFLVYITWIVILQNKGIRQYWWLSALSLLQVALGAVLAFQTGPYGLILLLYLPLALWTLSVFTLYQGAYELGGLAAEEDGARDDASATPESPFGETPASANGSTAAALLQSQFAVDRRATVRSSVHQDEPGRWIVPRFVCGVFGLTFAGLGLGLLIFLYVPRVSLGNARLLSSSSRAKAATGYSSTIQLGQIGQILESIDRVMRVRIFERFDAHHERFMKIEEFISEWGLSDPLFRGTAVDTYYGGGWAGLELDNVRLQQMSSHPLLPGIIRQEYTLVKHNSEHLFAMRPMDRARLYNPYDAINFSHETGSLSGATDRRDPIEYLVYSARKTAEERALGTNAFGRLPGQSKLVAFEKTRYLQLPESGLDGTIALARRVADSADFRGDGALSIDMRKARELEAYLRDSGRYQYSLNMEVDDPTRDPVEEFVMDRRRGHCEYFGSALALMLRAVKIPSRLVVGYKGADYHSGNPVEEGYYEVQQRHAHVWVEAYIDDDWVVLDATPASRDESVRDVAAKAGFWKAAKNSITDLWSTYVAGLSLDRQQRTLYDPLTGKVSTSWMSVREFIQFVTAMINYLRDALVSPEQFASRIRTIWLLVGLAGLAIGMRIWRKVSGRAVLNDRRPGLISRWFAWLLSFLPGRKSTRRSAIIVFYQRFLEFAAQSGFQMHEGQTQLEFAEAVALAWHDKLAPARLTDFPRQLAELFYRVRFGQTFPEPHEIAELNQRFSQLAQVLNG
jgi:protein-glutamine gamma-glutamyltransferase